MPFKRYSLLVAVTILFFLQYGYHYNHVEKVTSTIKAFIKNDSTESDTENTISNKTPKDTEASSDSASDYETSTSEVTTDSENTVLTNVSAARTGEENYILAYSEISGHTARYTVMDPSVPNRIYNFNYPFGISTRFSPNTPGNLVNPYVPYSYSQMLKDCSELARNFPDVIKQETLGKSLEGRDIKLLKLGSGSKLITLNGSHHAREYITTSLLMKMAETYARHYKANTPYKGYNVRNLLNKVTIYIVPMVNPDGVEIVQNGPTTSKNPELIKKLNNGLTGYSGWKANARGVDLNYQYPYYWEKTSEHPVGPERYKGRSPATEPEVRLMMNFTLNHPFLLHVAYHSQGEVLYWYTNQTGKLLDISRSITGRLSKLTGYRMLSEGEQANSYSGYKDWTVSELKKPGYTIEVCPYTGDLPYPDRNFNDVWKKADTTGLFFASEALALKGYDYAVYKSGRLIQLFLSKKEADTFAAKYAPAVVKYKPSAD